MRGVGEPSWAGRSAAEHVECQRHEALLNLAFATTSAFRLLCPYDTTALLAAVIEEARRSHPHVTVGHEQGPSDAYPGLPAITGPFATPLPAPPGAAEQYAFDAGRIEEPLAGRVRPSGERGGGWGLWLANQLCELVQVRCFADGSAVRLHMKRS